MAVGVAMGVVSFAPIGWELWLGDAPRLALGEKGVGLLGWTVAAWLIARGPQRARPRVGEVRMALTFALWTGLLAAGLTRLTTWGFDVGPGVDAGQRVPPGAEQHPLAYLVWAGLPRIVRAAVAEEIWNRGIIQGYVTRWLGGGRGAVGVGVAGAAVWWAMEHWTQTDLPQVRVPLLVGIGVAFGVLSHRFGVLSAALAHAMLNLAVVLLPR